MRLRSFTAPTIAQAMKLVRDELGPEAIIVSTQGASKGAPARVTAAIEQVWDELEPAGEVRQASLRKNAPGAPSGAAGALVGRAPEDQARRLIRDAFDFHGVPAVLAQRLGGLAGDVLGTEGVKDDALLALAGALDRRFRFAPLPDPCERARPIILVGPPGAGKTATVAKLAARAVLGGKRVAVISTDTVRAGGVEQLAAFTKLLGLDIQVAEDPGALADGVLAAANLDGVFIDTAGANPYDDAEMAGVRTLVESSRAEAILVLAAGGDPLEAAETAVAFAEVGARRLLGARLDAARRLGSLLTAAEAGKLAYAEVGTTAHIARGLTTLNPLSLARLLLGPLIELQRTPDQSAEPIKAVS